MTYVNVSGWRAEQVAQWLHGESSNFQEGCKGSFEGKA